MCRHLLLNRFIDGITVHLMVQSSQHFTVKCDNDLPNKCSVAGHVIESEYVQVKHHKNNSCHDDSDQKWS